MKPPQVNRRRQLLGAGLAGTLASALAPAQAAPAPRAEPEPGPTPGRIERWADFKSRHVAPRHIDIWQPPGLAPGQRLPVLYMHDGQMLFDASSTWNRQAWDAQATAMALISAGRVPPFFIVGIWNGGPLRHSEYYPQAFLDHLAPALRQDFTQRFLAGQPRSDAYLRFLVEELKPAVDRALPTQAGPAGTAVMGSSMGGLISLYALCEYPQVFGSAAGLSTHWIGTRAANAALPLAAFNYLREKLPAPAGHRLYLDRGTEELDALYGPGHDFVEQIVRERGYTEREAMLRTFPGTGHNERAWAARLALPMAFVLGAG